MLTNNFAGLVSLNCQSSSANYNVCKTTDGKPASGGYSWLRSIMPNSLLLKNAPSSSATGVYIVLGTGTTPATAADISLENVTEDYEIITQTKDVPLKFSSSIMTITRVIRNTGNAPLTISEVGLYASYSGGFMGAMMLAREVIEPVTLQPGEKHSFTMDICVQ
ncbi:unknown [Coprococcus sp. CAG:131]|jgi:hypothetical protein|nr:unknown [Coprococcus sp. CAG:131]